MVGVPLVLGADTHANARIVTQVPGRALVIDSAKFADHARDGSPLHSLLLRYGQFLVEQASQAAVCNRIHPIEQRCAKWFLIIHDRVDGDSFQLDDEFLEDMLGVKAPAVARARSSLEAEGLIDSPRPGAYEIVDRDGLETVACDCYRVVADAYEKVRVTGPRDFAPGLRVHSGDGDGVLRLEGELDLSTVGRLRTAVKELLPIDGDLILDMSGLGFVDSTGLQTILNLSGLLASGSIILRRPSTIMRKLLDVTGMENTRRIKVETGDRAKRC